MKKFISEVRVIPHESKIKQQEIIPIERTAVRSYSLNKRQTVVTVWLN